MAAAGFISLVAAAGGLTAVSAPASAAPASSPATSLYAWGDNGEGQFGNGSTSSSFVPVLVSLPAGVGATAVSEGEQTSLAVGSDGNVYAWGNGEFGQLGNGSTTFSSTPVRVSLPSGVTATAVSEGVNTSLAVGSDGNVYAWGMNGQGQLGDGSTATSSTPVKVSLPGGVAATAVSEGESTSLALGSDGNVYAWGVNTEGQLGDGSTTGSPTPVRVSLPAGVTATAVSEGNQTSLALGSDGNVYAWGSNSEGQLGDGSMTLSPTPVPVRVSLPGGVTATAVSEGGQTSLAVGSDGNVYAWGDNLDGQLGEGSPVQSLTPVEVSIPGAPTATAVAEGFFTSLAITRGGTGPVSTMTSVTASPNPAPAGGMVTLTATVSAANGSIPQGTVQFVDALFAIGSPVAVNASGVASTTMAVPTAGTFQLSAAFTPTSSPYAPSTGAVSLVVNPAPTGTEPITVGIPQSGVFTLTITPGTVSLAATGLTATGTLEDITVTDSRNYYPGWSVSGQESAFSGSGTAAGSTISGNQLGWTPIAVGPQEDFAGLGGTVAPASPGLGTTAATLALAPPGCGFGTNVVSANLTLAIPATALAGPYNGTMTITAVTTGPQNEVC